MTCGVIVPKSQFYMGPHSDPEGNKSLHCSLPGEQLSKEGAASLGACGQCNQNTPIMSLKEEVNAHGQAHEEQPLVY